MLDKQLRRTQLQVNNDFVAVFLPLLLASVDIRESTNNPPRFSNHYFLAHAMSFNLHLDTGKVLEKHLSAKNLCLEGGSFSEQLPLYSPWRLASTRKILHHPTPFHPGTY